MPELVEERLTVARHHRAGAEGKNCLGDGCRLDFQIPDRQWAWAGGKKTGRGDGDRRGPQIHDRPWAWAEERPSQEAKWVVWGYWRQREKMEVSLLGGP